MEINKKNIRPLAWRLIPGAFSEFFGQESLFGKGAPLRSMVEQGKFISSLLWGPPGCGKTAFSRFIADKLNYKLVFINAVNSDVKEIRQALKLAEFEKTEVRTLLVIDEIEHFSRSQQNVFLPCIEKGDVDFIGISFENPYYRMNTALLSRLKIFEFKALSQDALKKIMIRAVKEGGLFKEGTKVQAPAADALINEAGGDARKLLNLIELISMSHTGMTVEPEERLVR